MALEEGQNAPDFVFEDEEGNQKYFHEVEGKRIVFFFPAAFTPTCTAQACSLRDNYDNLKQEGISEVFAISMDPKEKVMKFKEKKGLEYVVIADEDGSISKRYDVYNNFLIRKVTGRVTYTVDENNTIISAIDSGIRGNKSDKSPEFHAQEIMENIFGK